MATQKIQPTPDTEVQRLRQAAEHLQGNPLWNEALDTIEAEYIREWRETSPVQTTQRENAFFMVQAVGKLRQQINSFAQAGALHREHTKRNVAGKV